MGSTRAMALGPLVDEFLRRGRDEQGSPARAMFEAEIARTALRLGYEASRDGQPGLTGGAMAGWMPGLAGLAESVAPVAQHLRC